MNAGSAETTLYVGGLDIITDSSGTWYRHTITAYGKPVLLETLSNNTSGAPKEDKHYLLNDHLGSVDTVVRDSDSTVVPRESFDAFGQRRDKSTWYGAMNATDLANARKVTHRGYTHHEHLDNLAGLVHAGGRVLDSVTGRFLSVDPMYQAPSNSQSVNPYSYVMNNPLSLVDPTGYAAVASTLESTVNENGGSGAPAPATATLQDGDSLGKLADGTVVLIHADGSIDMTVSSVSFSFTTANGSGALTQSSSNVFTASTTANGTTSGTTGTAEPSPTPSGSADQGSPVKLTQAQEDAFKKQKVSEIQGGDSLRETKYQWTDGGTYNRKTQNGCNGDDDCVWYKSEILSDTTALGHTHIRAPTKDPVDKLSREIPGPNDAAPLQDHKASTVLTANNAHYAIEGTYEHPTVRYLGGGNSALGKFIEENWHPDTSKSIDENNSYVKGLAQKYLDSGGKP